MLVIFLMPFTIRLRRGHAFNVTFICLIVVGAGVLFVLAKTGDAHDPDYQTAVKDADARAARVKLLAQSQGIPPEGALALSQTDPLTQGPKLFSQNCASCHRFNGTDGLGNPVKDAQSASDLAGFASREWIAGLLDPQRITSTNYFGATKHKNGKMVKFVQKDVAGFTSDQKIALQQVIAALSAEAHLRSQQTADARDTNVIKQGIEQLTGDINCVDCHEFRGEPGATAPKLTGYGSREWLVQFLSNPGHNDFYGTNNDRMPAFGEKQILSAGQIGLIADWLRGDWVQ